MVRLSGVADGTRVEVTDTQGRLVAASEAAQGRIAFQDKPRGLYLVKVGGRDASSVPLKFILP
jgi:hypothetical protein